MKRLVIIIWFILIIIGLSNCSTVNNDQKQNDYYDSDDWKERLKKCRAFMYMENDAWHWCMENKKEKDMTEHIEKVANRKLEIEKEEKDNQVLSIETKIVNGKWTEQTTSYASGKTVTEFNDKRKKNKVENG